MTLKKVYSCNICGVSNEDRLLFGVHFDSERDFTLGGYKCTEGVHICYKCARQLKTHLNNSEISRILEGAAE